MKPAFQSRTPRMLAATLALFLGLASSAFAEPPCGDRWHHHGSRSISHKHWHGHGSHHHGSWGLGFSRRLHDELKLDAKQEALWKEARQFVKEGFDGSHERFRKHHDEISALLDQPGADLRTIAKRMDDLRAERQKRHDAVRERWLSVYDALSPGQKEKVRIFLKDRIERHQRAFDKRRWHHDGRPCYESQASAEQAVPTQK